jgi:DNA-directed RNA polymerase specialized sigma24 family protein
VVRFRGVSPRCAECDALAFTWILEGERLTVECTFCGTPMLEGEHVELGEEQRDRLEQHEAERVLGDGGIERRDTDGPRQATLAERLDAGQRHTVDRATVGEDLGHELPNFEPLSGRQVAVWVSVELNGYEPRDFARSVGIAPSTARTHLQRARERMGGNR